jgi:hypothetical protein
LENPFNKLFSAEPPTITAWMGMTLSHPEFQLNKLIKALEEAIYGAHTHTNTQPSATIQVLSDWKYTSYLTLNLHTNYIKKKTHYHTHTHTKHHGLASENTT